MMLYVCPQLFFPPKKFQWRNRPSDYCIPLYQNCFCTVQNPIMYLNSDWWNFAVFKHFWETILKWYESCQLFFTILPRIVVNNGFCEKSSNCNLTWKYGRSTTVWKPTSFWVLSNQHEKFKWSESPCNF